MNRDEATSFVIQSLAKGKAEADIVRALCNSTNLTEIRAKQFIAQIKRNSPQSTPSNTRSVSSTSMNRNTDLEDYIVRSLARGRSPNDIVLYIAENAGMAWNDAEAFVAQIANRNASTITRRQTPITLPISLGMTLLGLVIVIVGIVLIVLLLTVDVRPTRLRNIQTIIYLPVILLIGFGIFIAGARSTKQQLAAFDAPGKFYQNIGRWSDWANQNRKQVAIGSIASLLVISVGIFIFAPRLSPSSVELAQQYVAAVTRGSKSEAINLYGPTNICHPSGAGRLSQAQHEYDRLISAAGGSITGVITMELSNWNNPPSDDWESVDVNIQSATIGALRLSIYTAACSSTRRCICRISIH